MGLGNPTSLPGRVAARDSIPVPRVQHRKGPPTHILAAESKFDDVRCARWASAARVPFDCWLRSSFRMTGAPAGLAVLPLRTIMVSLGPFLTHMCSRISPRCRRIMGGFKSKASTLPSRTCLSSSSIVAPELARAFAAIASPLAAILCTVSTASRPHSLSLLRRRLRCGCLLRRRLLRQGGPRGGPAHLPREHDHPAERARARRPPIRSGSHRPRRAHHLLGRALSVPRVQHRKAPPTHLATAARVPFRCSLVTSLDTIVTRRCRVNLCVPCWGRAIGRVCVDGIASRGGSRSRLAYGQTASGKT